MGIAIPSREPAGHGEIPWNAERSVGRATVKSAHENKPPAGWRPGTPPARVSPTFRPPFRPSRRDRTDAARDFRGGWGSAARRRRRRPCARSRSTLSPGVSGDPSSGYAVSDVVLHAPIPRPPQNVIAVGANYRAHIAEGARARNAAGVPPLRGRRRGRHRGGRRLAEHHRHGDEIRAPLSVGREMHDSPTGVRVPSP